MKFSRLTMKAGAIDGRARLSGKRTGVWIFLSQCMIPALICNPGPAALAQQQGTNVKDTIVKLLQEQNDAWNKGDLDTFMQGYIKSPDLSYSSGGKEVWGYDALRERYQKKYGDNKATMGKLNFTDLRVFELGASNALCIGHWHLVRDNQPNLDGTFSLVLVQTKEGWKILHDHTSVLAQS